MFKKILSLSFALLLVLTVAEEKTIAADDAVNATARALLIKLKKKNIKAPKKYAAPLLNFSLSPSDPLQNQNLSVFIQPDTTFQGRDISIDMSVNGIESKNLQQPAKNLFVQALGLQTESKSYALEATIFIENTQDNTEIRDAVKALDVDINRLTNKISKERDPVQRKILQGERAEKIALKTELLEQLKKFRIKVGTQNFAFTVKPNPTDITLPKITNISPITGSANGGTLVTISGANFTENAEVKFEGILSPLVTFINANTLQVVTPDFAGIVGAKDIELRFTDTGKITNTISPKAFFAGSFVPAVNTKPVAIAAGSQKIRLSEQITLNGSESYDTEQNPFNYTWKYVSVPANSSFAIGSIFSNTVNPTFTPDALGTFVVSLTVKENDTAELLESEPSLAVIEVNGAPMPTASPIIVGQGLTTTIQVFANNPNVGHANYYSITVLPEHGEATVNASGLVSFTANANYVGTDTLTVKVQDQDGLSGTVIIPITIEEVNHPPAPLAPSINVGINASQSSQVVHGDPDANQTHTYAITTSPILGTASVNASGLVTYTAGATGGSDSLIVTVTDEGNLTGEILIPVTVLANIPPIAGTLSYTIRSQGLPIAVGLFSAAPSDPDGQIVEYKWEAGDGTTEYTPLTGSGAAFALHNYVAPGIYTATFTVKDNLGATSSTSIQVNVQDIVLPTAKFSLDKFSCSAPCTINTDASLSSGPVGISSYRWLWGDGSPEQIGGGLVTASHTYTNPGTYNIRFRTRDTNFSQGQSFATVYVGVSAPSTGSPASVDFTMLPTHEVLLGSTVNFDAGRSFDPNPAGAITNYAWSFNDYSQCPMDGCTGSGETTTFSYPNAATTYFPFVTLTNALGGTTRTFGNELIVVNAGHAPRPFIRVNGLFGEQSVTGAAPLTANFTSFSFDYDGTITNHNWNFGDSTSSADTDVSHTYTVPGVYFLSLTVTDNDLNMPIKYLQVNVNPSYSLPPVKSFGENDSDPNYDNKANLASACGQGSGEACYYLAKIYQEEGNNFVYQELMQRSCTLGYQTACSGF